MIRLDYYSAKKYVQLECADTGKQLQFHKHGTIPGPHTDGTTIHVMEPNGLWGDEEWDEWEYEVYHEIGHESPENSMPHWKDLVMEKEISTRSLLGSLWNLMSDHIQEHNRVGRYSGRDKVLKRGRMRFVRDRLLSADKLEKEQETHEGRIFKVVAIYDTLRREEWNEYLTGGTTFAAQSLDGDEKVMWDKLVKADIPIETGTNEHDSYQFAMDILRALGEDADEHEKQAKDQYKQEQEEGEEGEGEEGDGEGKASGKAVKGKLSKKAAEEIKGMSHHVHYSKPTGEDAYSTSMSSLDIEYGDTSNFCTSFVPRDPVVVDMKKEDYAGAGRPDQYSTDEYRRMINEVAGGELLARQVRSLIVAAKQSRYEHGRKRGKISPKNLWKATAPLYEQRVFRKKVDRLEKNTAVTVVTDNSGSMGGDRFCHAAKAGVMLANALTKANVPVELISFTENHDGPLNIIVKAFSEMRVDGDTLVERYAKCASFMNQNSDGESILWAAQRLAKRPEQRRVIIVLSDGQPASWYGENGAEYVYTKKVIESLQDKACPLEVYGIGIQSDSVKEFYKDYVVINGADELEVALLKVVKAKVLGR